ncbi:MAG TPA: ABC transporter substrate-binding protein [Stellaceae bacterium]|nr:ABC transporter substrate-binding protein [Stellaceae bacterium]
MTSRPSIFVLALLALLPATAAAQNLRIALQDDPDTLDPAKNWTFVGRHVLSSLCDKLVDIDPEGRIVPQLATEWTTAEDGLSVTFKLRSGVTFHDGEAFDAAAVKFNVERELTLPGSRRKSEIAAVASAEIVDPLTVRLRLKAPFAPLVAQFTDRAGMMVAPKAAAEAGDKFDQHPVCAGPYKFVERVPQDRIVLEMYPGYWNAARYHFARVTFLPISDASVRFANLRAGQLDLIERLAPSDLEALKADKSLAWAAVTGLAYQGITFNVGNGDGAKNPFAKDKRLRQALELSLDRKAIDEVAFNGLFAVGNQPFPPGTPYYVADRPVPGRDVAKAKALLAEAGMPHPHLTLLVPTNNELRPVAQLVQDMAKEAGIDIELQSIELITMLAEARQGKFEADLIGWSGRVDPDGNTSLLLACGAAGNDGHYCNPAFDKLLEAARETTDEARRKTLYAEAVRILLDDRPIIYLYHQKWLYGMSARITGFTAYPDGLMRLGGVAEKG